MIFFPVQQACTGECTKHSESIIRNSFAGTERLCLIELSRRHLPAAFLLKKQAGILGYLYPR